MIRINQAESLIIIMIRINFGLFNLGTLRINENSVTCEDEYSTVSACCGRTGSGRILQVRNS